MSEQGASTKPPEDSSESRVKASRRRDKPQLSCTLCRQKKLKCDRAQPCKNCERRPLGSCVYVHSGGHKRIERASNGTSQSRNISVQDRIRRLERLVVSLAETPKALGDDGQLFAPNDDPDTTKENFKAALNGSGTSRQDVAGSFGRLSVDDSETRFVNPSHWEAILDDISEIKDAISSPPSSNTGVAHISYSDVSQSPEILFGQRENISATEIICSLPAKSAIDELINLFLKSLDIPPLTLHVPTFQKEYDAFWENPEAASITWVALLHAHMALALQFLIRTGMGPIEGIPFPESMAKLLTRRAASCLLLADYTKPTHYTVQAMIMYLACEHFLNTGAEFRSSLVFSVAVRLAMRSGYHRDPSHYPQMTIFEGEIRRREWALIVQLDLVFSSTLGLPRLIDERQTDTAPPFNLLDADLDPGMTEIPKPRPATEQTWIGYMNFKTKMLSVLGKVVDRTNSIQEISYHEVLNLEQDVQAASASKPEWLELPRDGSLASLSISALTRLVALDLITQRARMILHRRFLIEALSNKTYSYSRQCCLTAATRALQYQRELYELSRAPDGLLSSSWKFFSLMSHDFLLAAMIICLDLDQTLLRMCPDFPADEELQDKKKRFELLESSYQVWTESLNHSPEAKKAAEVLKVMLERVERKKGEIHGVINGQIVFKTPEFSSTNASGSSETASTIESQSDAPFEPNYMPEIKPPNGPEGMSGVIIDGNDGFNGIRNGFMNPDTQAFQTILSSPNNFDWLEWDSQFQQGLNLQL